MRSEAGPGGRWRARCAGGAALSLGLLGACATDVRGTLSLDDAGGPAIDASADATAPDASLDARPAADAKGDVERDALTEAATGDASAPDADAAIPDAGETDASGPDSGSADASGPDSGSPDASGPDSGCTPGRSMVCGRDVPGVRCALSGGAAYVTSGAWSTLLFGDTTGWSSAQYYSTVQTPDVNGDGRADVCGRGIAGIYCAVSTGATFDDFRLWHSGFDDAGGWAASPGYYGTIQFPDVDGDGKADICGRGAGGVVCARSSGTSFGAATVWHSAFSNDAGWSAAAYYATIQFPDLNGDGKADVCGRGPGGIQCALSNGASFGAIGTWHSDFTDAGGWATSASHYATIQFPDLNGDGKADLCGRGTGGMLCALSNGTAFGAGSVWQSEFRTANGWSTAPYYSTIQFPDIDGDGKADVCGRGVNGIVCGKSDGAQFSALVVAQAELRDATGWSSAAYYPSIQFPDVDGDGKADVCGRGTYGVGCGLSNGSTFGTLAWLPDFTDAMGWNAKAYGSTLQFPRMARGTCRPDVAATPARSPAARFGL